MSRYECYITFISTKPEGVARGRGAYKCDIALVA